MDLNNKLDTLITEFNDKKKEFQRQLQNMFREAVNQYWANNPKIYAIGWVQFTPYFNDGEPCEFGRHEMVPFTEDSLENGSSYIDPESDSVFQVNYDLYRKNGYKDRDKFLEKQEWETSDITLDEWNKAVEDVGLLEKIPDDMYLEMFGDHVRVVLFRDKEPEIEDVDHN